jgi:hypothetical protein
MTRAEGRQRTELAGPQQVTSRRWPAVEIATELDLYAWLDGSHE